MPMMNFSLGSLKYSRRTFSNSMVRNRPDRSYAIKKRFGLPIIKAFAVEAKSDFAQLKAYQPIGAWLLFDAKAPAEATRPGGLGQPVDWPMIREKRPEWALTSDLGKPFDWALMSGAIPGVPVILSGGLNAGNVGEALRITRVPAVDVSSGVETSPGRKDARRFVISSKPLVKRIFVCPRMKC